MNIIPLIGKADSISKTELQQFKRKLISELVSNGVRIYQFPTDDEAVFHACSSVTVLRIMGLYFLQVSYLFSLS